MNRFLFTMATLLALHGSASTARAELSIPEGDRVFAGVSASVFPGQARPRLALGLDASCTRNEDVRWWGIVGDLRYDFSERSLVLGVGPRIGWTGLAVDALLFARIGEEHAVGIRPRFCTTLGVASICGGPEISTSEVRGEVTISLKYPFLTP
ncbi:MAG: hypothetical protein AAF411_04575 [Myxococcota bacterium]